MIDFSSGFGVITISSASNIFGISKYFSATSNAVFKLVRGSSCLEQRGGGDGSEGRDGKRITMVGQMEGKVADGVRWIGRVGRRE